MTPQQLYDHLNEIAGPDSDWREYLMNAAVMIRDQGRRLAALEERVTKAELAAKKPAAKRGKAAKK